MNLWNLPNQNHDETVSLMFAGPQSRTQVWHNAFAGDNRFRIITIASSPDDMHAKLATNPDVILLDAAIFPGPQPLIGELSNVHAMTYVVLPHVPSEDSQRVSEALLALEPVKGVYQVDTNLSVLAERIYGDVRARSRIETTHSSLWSTPNSGEVPVSTRIITVWNQMGGVGKTTISSNLAIEAAKRGYPTLLVGLGAPDDLPLVLGLKAQPNITYWHTNPSADGLKLAIQKRDTLDVIGGYPDSPSRAQAMSYPQDHPASLKSLVNSAILAGYAVIIFDAPQDGMSFNAITASNTLVIVGRPSTEGIYRTVEAYRTVMERFSGMHNITANRVYVVLNRTVSGYRVDADRWHKFASEHLGHAFPPITAQIPDMVEVGDAQDHRQIPLDVAPPFANALKPLVDALFINGSGNGKKSKEGRVWHLGKIKLRF